MPISTKEAEACSFISDDDPSSLMTVKCLEPGWFSADATMTSIASDAASTGNAKLFTIPRKPANSSTTAMSRGLTAGEDAMLAELQKLVALSSQHPVAEQELFSFKANSLLQFLGILAATVFGVFSILAWLAATKSNEISTNALNQALQSNQLALLAYCVSGGKNVRR